MKVTLERAALLKSLGHVHRVVERRNTIPILSNVLIQAKGAALLLKATDLDLEVDRKARRRRQRRGRRRRCPRIRSTTSCASSPTARRSRWRRPAKRGQLQLRSGRSRFNLQTLPDSDFPDLAAGDFTP